MTMSMKILLVPKLFGNTYLKCRLFTSSLYIVYKLLIYLFLKKFRDRGLLNGASQKAECINVIHIGEVALSLQVSF